MAFCKFWLWGLTWVWSLTESLVQPSKQWDMQKKEGETTVHFADTLRRELKSCYENLHPTVIGVISKEASNLSGWLALPGSGSATWFARNQGTGWRSHFLGHPGLACSSAMVLVCDNSCLLDCFASCLLLVVTVLLGYQAMMEPLVAAMDEVWPWEHDWRSIGHNRDDSG